MTRTPSPPRARAAARLTVDVVFPTPPFWLAIVMMRGVSTWAVAVRLPTPEDAPADELGDIEVKTEPLVSWTKKHRAYRLPIIRGVVALAESLVIGFRALGIAANAQVPDHSGRTSSSVSRSSRSPKRSTPRSKQRSASSSSYLLNASDGRASRPRPSPSCQFPNARQRAACPAVRRKPAS